MPELTQPPAARHAVYAARLAEQLHAEAHLYHGLLSECVGVLRGLLPPDAGLIRRVERALRGER